MRSLRHHFCAVSCPVLCQHAKKQNKSSLKLNKRTRRAERSQGRLSLFRVRRHTATIVNPISTTG